MIMFNYEGVIDDFNQNVAHFLGGYSDQWLTTESTMLYIIRVLTCNSVSQSKIPEKLVTSEFMGHFEDHRSFGLFRLKKKKERWIQSSHV